MKTTSFSSLTTLVAAILPIALPTALHAEGTACDPAGETRTAATTQPAATTEAEAPQPPAPPEQPATLAEALAALRETLTTLTNDKENPSRLSAATRYLTALERAVETNNHPVAIQQADTLSSYYPAAEDKIATVRSLINQQFDAETRQQIHARKSLLTRLGEALLSATKPEQLDKWLAELATHASSHTYGFSGSGSASTNELRALNQQLNTASQITSQWQDYLMGLKLADTSRAKNAISNISRSATTFPYIPRSHILELEARLDSPAPAADGSASSFPFTPDACIKRITSHEAALQLFSELKTLGSTKRSNYQLDTLYQNLDSYQLMVNYFNSGSISTAMSKYRSLLDISYMKPLAQKAATDTLVRHLGITGPFKPDPELTPSANLEAYLEHLKTTRDWGKLLIAIESGGDFTARSQRDLFSAEEKQLKLFLNATFLEKAGQYARAIVAYRNIDGGTTRYVPAELAVQRMVALEKKYPEEAEKSRFMSDHRRGYSPGYMTRITTTQRQLIREEIRAILKQELDARQPDANLHKAGQSTAPRETPTGRRKPGIHTDDHTTDEHGHDSGH